MKECPSYPERFPMQDLTIEDLVKAPEMKIEDVKKQCEENGWHAMCLRNLDDETMCKVVYRPLNGENLMEKEMAEDEPEIFLYI